MGTMLGKEIVAEYRSNAAWNVEGLQLHDYYEINLALMDAGMFFLEGQVYPLRRGTLISINNTLLHRNVSTDPGYYRCIIKFMPHVVEKFSTKQTDLLSIFSKKNPVSQLNEAEISQLLQLIQPLVDIKESSSYGSDVLQRVYLVEILVYLNQLASTTSYIAPQETGPGVSRISPILKYINNNIMNTITLDSLSDRFFISKSHLCDIFKKTIGMTVNEYILHRRILIAKQLMSQDISLLEICNQCGFNSYTSFARNFKVLTGVNPKEYRNKLWTPVK